MTFEDWIYKAIGYIKTVDQITDFNAALNRIREAKSKPLFNVSLASPIDYLLIRTMLSRDRGIVEGLLSHAFAYGIDGRPEMLDIRSHIRTFKSDKDDKTIIDIEGGIPVPKREFLTEYRARVSFYEPR